MWEKYYDRKYERLSRRLGDAFDALEVAEKIVADKEAMLDSIKKQGLCKESSYESLKIFDEHFDNMTDLDKKSFVNIFIENIKLYLDKERWMPY